MKTNTKSDSRSDGLLTPYPLPLTPYPLPLTPNSLIPNSGFTLFYAVLVSSLLLALGLAIFNITYKELILSAGARESATAFYAADSGLECALFWDRKHTGKSSPIFGFYGDSLASGLQAYWPFDEGEGDDAFDVSGQNNHGDIDGATWAFANDPDGELLFDGIDDHVSLGEPVVLPQDFTVSLWYDIRDDGASERMITGGGPDDDSGQGRALGFANTDAGLFFFVRIEDGGAADTSVAAVTGGWHHLALVRRSGKIDLIIDGDTSGAHRLFGNSDQDGTFQIYALGTGNPEGPAEEMYMGSLDDIRIYNRALSDVEILETAQNGSNIIFTDPVVPNSDVLCMGADITDPALGWETATSTTAATSSFDITFPGGRCASIDVFKNTSTTTIISRGYNNCDKENPRRVERAIRAIY